MELETGGKPLQLSSFITPSLYVGGAIGGYFLAKKMKKDPTLFIIGGVASVVIVLVGISKFQEGENKVKNKV